MKMDIKDAVVLRFKNICAERHITLNQLAVVSGITPSTVYSLADPKRRQVEVRTVKVLCDGLGITLADFFTDAVFDEVGPELI